MDSWKVRTPCWGPVRETVCGSILHLDALEPRIAFSRSRGIRFARQCIDNDGHEELCDHESSRFRTRSGRALLEDLADFPHCNASLRKVGEQAPVKGLWMVDKGEGQPEAEEEFAYLKIVSVSGSVGVEDTRCVCWVFL